MTSPNCEQFGKTGASVTQLEVDIINQNQLDSTNYTLNQSKHL